MYSQKKSKLVNPYFFVSRTRLSVHNLPVNVDEQRLKRVFLQAAAAAAENSDEAKVTQVLQIASSNLPKIARENAPHMAYENTLKFTMSWHA